MRDIYFKNLPKSFINKSLARKVKIKKKKKVSDFPFFLRAWPKMCFSFLWIQEVTLTKIYNK